MGKPVSSGREKACWVSNADLSRIDRSPDGHQGRRPSVMRQPPLWRERAGNGTANVRGFSNRGRGRWAKSLDPLRNRRKFLGCGVRSWPTRFGRVSGPLKLDRSKVGTPIEFPHDESSHARTRPCSVRFHRYVCREPVRLSIVAVFSESAISLSPFNSHKRPA